MKIREVLERLDTPFHNCHGYSEIIRDTTGYEDWLDLERHGFKARPVTQWICTDTHVGMDAIYYQDELVAVTYQPARKADTEVQWVSRQAFEKVRAVILALQDDRGDRQFILLDQEVDEFKVVNGQPVFQVLYAQEILGKEVLYQGKPAEVTYKPGRMNEIKDWHTLHIRQDDQEKKVPMREVFIPIKVKAP